MISLRRFLRSERPLENGPQALSHTIMRALAAAAKGGNTKAITGSHGSGNGRKKNTTIALGVARGA